MLTIITPCCRQKNLSACYNSIQFDAIHQWIIVYDTSKDRTYPHLYEGNPKILEVECNAGISGNPQRNYGLSLVTDGYIYFLDDDNIIHPEFWNTIYKELINRTTTPFYTCNQIREKEGRTLYGNTIAIGNVDTAMFLVHKKHIGAIQWAENKYDADGYFIRDIARNNPGAHQYINTIAAYYNHIE